MSTAELHPATQAMADALFEPGFFDIDPRQLVKKESIEKRNHGAKPGGARRSGQKSLLTAEDFILPELVKRSDNGDLAISVGSSSDSVQLEQIFRLAECGEEPSPSFAELSHAEQQLEKRRYLDHLKRVPKKEMQRAIRQEELEIWTQGGPDADSNFHSWFERKQARKKSAILKKANRIANCGSSGRRMDCRDHAEHMFFGEFKCQCRYCRRCGGEVFGALFGKYVGLWPTVQKLLPANGFRSKVVIAKLDFTATNLGRMATPAEIRVFNQDIRECVRRAQLELGIGSKQYGFLWCDEFGGWDPKKESYNTNLHAHGVYVGPYIPQDVLARIWTEIRAAKDGAKVVWIEKQKIDNPPAEFLACERRRFIRALGHSLKYTGKHVSRSDGKRLAELEMAFHTVRRVHTMGLFYHADLRCQSQCGHCDTRCELVNGHEGDHRCKAHGHENRCPLCDGYLMFPRDSGYAPVSELRKEGRRELGDVRRQVSRDRIFNGPRGPDGEASNAA
jgi:hypothetical protein